MSNVLPIDADAILFVDDEPLACKWFMRTFEKEFNIFVAGGMSEALELLASHSGQIAILVTDFRMPVHNGLELLCKVQQHHRHVIRLMASAYAEKDILISAVNKGQVFRILEKPLDEENTRVALREALDLYRQRAHEQAVHEGRAGAMRETLGFLAHELNTPLAIVRGYMTSLNERMKGCTEPSVQGNLILRENRPGQIAAAINSAERSAAHCQTLLATFVESARDAYPGAAPQTINASSLVNAWLEEYPFEQAERDCIVDEVEHDFVLPGRRDLLYLVLCTLAKNALHVLRDRPDGKLRVIVGSDPEEKVLRHWIRFEDNGPGIPSELLVRLSKEPVRTSSGGSGMGLLFCRRVVQSINGDLSIASESSRGTTVTLHFQTFNEANLEEAIA